MFAVYGANASPSPVPADPRDGVEPGDVVEPCDEDSLDDSDIFNECVMIV